MPAREKQSIEFRVNESEAWDDAMWRAKGQAERYARHLPAEEPPAPFLLVVDVGHSIEVYADFTQAGRAYTPFPGPRNFRIRLADLRDEAVRERLRCIWLDPLSLDPAKISAEVTREIAGYLATLAASLEKAGHPPQTAAEFLTRCLFCMFAEDVGLLEKDSFYNLLDSLRESPEGFVPKLQQLFREMQTGTEFSVVLNKKLLRFNGGLFEDASVLPLDGMQLGILILAAAQQWRNVEPAIFGTLLERALDPDERHKLGAHYTPRAYVERLVLPTIVEPLRSFPRFREASAIKFLLTRFDTLGLMISMTTSVAATAADLREYQMRSLRTALANGLGEALLAFGALEGAPTGPKALAALPCSHPFTWTLSRRRDWPRRLPPMPGPGSWTRTPLRGLPISFG